jgi:hypothetical protein
MNNITCFKCNQELPVQANYCLRCGVRLSDATSSEKIIALLEHIVKILESQPVTIKQLNNEATATNTITLEELPDVLTARHVSEFLGISKRRAYELFQLSINAGGIKSMSFGKSKRIYKSDFLEWLSNHTNR